MAIEKIFVLKIIFQHKAKSTNRLRNLPILGQNNYNLTRLFYNLLGNCVGLGIILILGVNSVHNLSGLSVSHNKSFS